jgi:pentatricopeptide repeat protein
MEGALPRASPQPNAATFLSATIACSRLGDWRRALRVKDDMLAR